MAFASLSFGLHLQRLHLPLCKFPRPTPPLLQFLSPSTLWRVLFSNRSCFPSAKITVLPSLLGGNWKLSFLSLNPGSTSQIQRSKMPEIQLGAHTLRSHGIKVARTHMHDWIILGLLVVIEVVLNIIQPFHRFVGQEMMTDLRYPLKENTVPIWTVPIIALLIPFAFILAYYCFRKDVYDLHDAILGLLFSVLLTGVITDAIKDAVGRPRPDFFWRCFPDGKGVFDSKTGGAMCTGVSSIIKEGYKSFPSGHTSWSFAGLGFLAWYLSGKIRAFDRRGHAAKLCIVFLPLLVAALVGVSRVDDYWHHWQDVFAGGLLGITIASICYLQFFPLPYDIDGWGPHAYFQMLAESRDSVRASSLGNRNLNVQPAELQNICIHPHHNLGFYTRDSSAMH